MCGEGYLYRLACCFVDDERHYKVLPGTTPEEAAQTRQQLAAQLLPAKWRTRARFTAASLPRVYHTYKAKCLAPSGGSPAKSRTPTSER